VLNDIPYAGGVRFSAKPGCLHGTREKILADVLCLLNGTNQDVRPRVVLLTGTAGMGKSAIARTVAEHIDEQKRLGSSFFFDRLDNAKNRADNVFSTIACDTAGLDPRIKENLWDIIKENRSLRKTPSPREQFKHLILTPTEGLTTMGPTIIVMDALDECANEESRKELLEVLATQIPYLPEDFRFLPRGLTQTLCTRSDLFALCATCEWRMLIVNRRRWTSAHSFKKSYPILRRSLGQNVGG
jgi:hypothetical protein